MDKALKNLIKQYSVKNRISFNSSLYKDLGIKDDIAPIFMDAYAKEFNVNISDFSINNYLTTPEDTEINDWARKELTFEDLLRGISAGILNEQIIGFEDNDPNLPFKFTIKNVITGIILVTLITLALGFVGSFL